MSVELPQWVVQNMVDEQRREWGPRLRALDPDLHLIPPFQNPPHPGMLANRWHLGRFSEIRGHEVFIPITGNDGEFREMDEAMFDALKRQDMHSNRSTAESKRRRELRLKSVERAKARAKAERIDEIAERVVSKERVSIHVPRGVR